MADKRPTAKAEKADTSATRIATIAAGAAIGSAAIAAAVLFANRKRDAGAGARAPAAPKTPPVHRPSPDTD